MVISPIECFHDGLFIKGESYDADGTYEYADQPRVKLEGFCVNENLSLVDNVIGCPGEWGIRYPEYKDKWLIKRFYPDLQDSLLVITRNNCTDNQWMIIGLSINKEGIPGTINVWSSIDDRLTESSVFKTLSSMNDFSPSTLEGNNNSVDLYFSILIRNNKPVIPKLYTFKNRVNF